MAIRELYRGRIIHLTAEDTTLPNGAERTFEVVRHPGASAIVAVDAERRVTLIRQFRFAAGGFIWEVPAGVIEPNEEPLACGKRELREETGLVAEDWTFLGSILTSPGFCDERIYLFLARRLTVTEPCLEEDELLTVSRVPLEQALAMVRNGEIQDAKSIAGLHHAREILAPSSDTRDA